jgi:putative DNA primase/helicase
VSLGLAHTAGVLFLASRVPGAPTPDLVRWHGGFYEFTGACYRHATDEAVQNRVTAWLASNPGARTDPATNKVQPITSRFVTDVMLGVRTHATIPDTTAPGSWTQPPPAGAVGPYLATPGGVLDLGRIGDRGLPLLPGSPDFFALSALAVTPDPGARCPHWARFLREAFPGDTTPTRLLQEIFGYTLWPDCRFEKIVIAYGPGNSGKSTLAETLQAVLGADSTAALTLERLGDRFGLPALVGKLANIVYDVNEIDRAAEGTLKMLASGERVPVEEKHRPVFATNLTAKHLFLTNVLPHFRDFSDGLWRRLILVPFDRVCPPEKRDPLLKAKLRAELPAIAAWALRGLARLHRQGGFTPYGPGDRMAAEHRQDCNPVAQFLAEECAADPDARVGRQALYGRFRAWAEAAGHTPGSITRFNRAVRALHPQPDGEVRDGRGGDRMFVGLRLRERPGVAQQFRLLAAGGDGRA